MTAKALGEAIAAVFKVEPRAKRRRRRKTKQKTLHGNVVEAIKELCETDWERYDTQSRIDTLNDCARRAVAVVRRHQRRIAAKKGTAS